MFFVVETFDDLLIGRVEFVEGGVVVHNGFVGRPVVIPGDELVSITPAENHPDVEGEIGTPEQLDYIKVG